MTAAEESAAPADWTAYRRLFLANVLALLGTGIATVGLALAAFDLAPDDAGAVLGTALAIKMAAYVLFAPLGAAVVGRLPRGTVMIASDLVRAAVALTLPWVDAVWQVYLLIFVFQAASGIFLPAYQATVPDLLPDERDYVRAIAKARLAYDLEALLSPALAAALLLLVTWHGLFVGTSVGFLVSAWLITRARLPSPRLAPDGDALGRLSLGLRAFWLQPRLRGLAAIGLVAAVASAMVTVNTVVLTQGELDLTSRATAIAYAVFGAGSILATLLLPRILEQIPDRTAMLAGALVLVVALLAGVVVRAHASLLVLWFALGVGCAITQTPAASVLRRSSSRAERQQLYAVHFALGNIWLIGAYPLAGHLGASISVAGAFAVFAVLAAAGAMLAAWLWPRRDARVLQRGGPLAGDGEP